MPSNVIQPLVSVVIPCYNGERFVGEAIDSVLIQDLKDCEIIVVDDGSTDRSLDVIREFGDRVRLEAGPNRGACHARNRGVDLASGEFVKFLDSDDVLVPGGLEQEVAVIRHLPEDVICFGHAVDFDSGNAVYDRVGLNGSEDLEATLLGLLGGDIITSCPLHRRSLLRRQAAFLPVLQRGQEWNFHVQLALEGVRFARHENPVYRYRRHDGADRITNFRSKDEAFRKELARYLITYAVIEAHYAGDVPRAIARRMSERLTEAACMKLGSAHEGILDSGFASAWHYGRGTHTLRERLHHSVDRLAGPTRRRLWARRVRAYLNRS